VSFDLFELLRFRLRLLAPCAPAYTKKDWRRHRKIALIRAPLNPGAGLRTPDALDSFLRHPLSTLLSTPGSVRVLRELLEADGPLAVNALAGRTGLSAQGVRNTLVLLRLGGIVEQLGEGRSRLYRADVGHPLYVPLGSLFHAEAERHETIMEALRTAVESLMPTPMSAWIYGNVARGVDGPDEDLEVALVAPDEDVATPVDRLREILGPIQDVQRVWISVIGLSPSDVRRLSAGDSWWKKATRPHMTLFGKGPDELAAELARPSGPRRPFRPQR
jgi:DNA-binding transcriptional ArsR family regulator